MSLSFAKESISTVKPTQSLLSISLSASQQDLHGSRKGSQQGSSLPDISSAGSLSSNEQGFSEFGGGKQPNFPISAVINAILDTYFSSIQSAVSISLHNDASRYILYVSDDDNKNADVDFPSIDPNVSINSVGISNFVLCDSLLNEKPILSVQIPSDSIITSNRESNSSLIELPVMCASIEDSKTSFLVRVGSSA
jgi:hypothetical protein